MDRKIDYIEFDLRAMVHTMESYLSDGDPASNSYKKIEAALAKVKSTLRMIENYNKKRND